MTFSLSVLYLRTLWSCAEGYTTIETWEQDRHDALVRRKRVRRQEFPYDIGFWDNLCSAHGGTANVVLWYWPLARTREVGEVVKGSGGLMLKGGLEWEVNGYERLDKAWPPVDPDKGVVVREVPQRGVEEPSEVWAEGVRRRQKEDLKRWEGGLSYPRIEDRWTNVEGETLADYGVEEEEEDEDVPLGELMRRRAR